VNLVGKVGNLIEMRVWSLRSKDWLTLGVLFWVYLGEIMTVVDSLWYGFRKVHNGWII
jgi:hypothetical protein